MEVVNFNGAMEALPFFKTDSSHEKMMGRKKSLSSLQVLWQLLEYHLPALKQFMCPEEDQVIVMFSAGSPGNETCF